MLYPLFLRFNLCSFGSAQLFRAHEKRVVLLPSKSNREIISPSFKSSIFVLSSIAIVSIVGLGVWSHTKHEENKRHKMVRPSGVELSPTNGTPLVSDDTQLSESVKATKSRNSWGNIPPRKVQTMELTTEVVKARDVSLVELSSPSIRKGGGSRENITIRYSSHVGVLGTTFLLVQLVLGGFIWYLVEKYSVSFSSFDRPGLWVFMVLGTVYVLSAFLMAWTWKKQAREYTKKSLKRQSLVDHPNRFMSMYRRTLMNGDYYLWKLYAMEALECLNQLNNVLQVYLCSLPLEWSVPICLFLGIDSVWKAYEVSQKNSPKRRFRQVIVDAIVDSTCMIVPLCIIWFVYKIPLTIEELLYVILIPGLCLFFKIRSLFKEIVRIQSVDLVIQRRRTTSMKNTLEKSRRKSHWEWDETVQMARKQQASIPGWVYKVIVANNILYGMFFLGVVVVQLASISKIDSGCKDKFPAWDSCLVKVPFCNDLLFSKSHCNCAVFEVNSHNWTRLPETVTTDMWALKRLVVRHGPLKQIPEDVDEKFERLSVLDMSYNHLSKISERFGDMSHLNQLKLANNMLTSLPHQIWNCVGLFWLEVDNNYIETLPDGISRAVQLRNLFASNNSLGSIPDEIGDANLAGLNLGGNQIRTLPASLGKLKFLKEFRLNGNVHISQLPKELGGMERLYSFDVRNNSLRSIPKEFENLKRLTYFYLDGNPICNSSRWVNSVPQAIHGSVSEESGAGCKPQCSMYCLDRWVEFNPKQICGRECNSKSCEFDGGVCLK